MISCCAGLFPFSESGDGVTRGNVSTGFMLIAFILFLIAALIAGGVITGSLPWLLTGGLAAMALSFLFGGHWWV